MSPFVPTAQPQRRPRRLFRGVPTAALRALSLALAMLPLAAANAQVFSNTAPISIPNVGTATPYPSTINVVGRAEPISGMRVTLNGFEHSFPADVRVLLVSPNGGRFLLMNAVGGGIPVTGVNLTFTSGNGDSIGAPIVSGTYLPTGGSATFAAPAPAGPYGADLRALEGASANGTWSLYVQDFAGGDFGSIAGGWTLDLVPSDPTSATGFTYQGRLTGGDASADFRVSLWDSATATAPARRIAGPLDFTGVTLDDGLFTLDLDFGVPIPGDTGAFLEIEVNSAGSGLVTLSPRQRIMPAPVAGTLTALTTLPAVAEIRGPQADLAAGSLTIRATGTTRSNGSGGQGGTLRLVAGNANLSGGAAPPAGTSGNNNVHIIAGDNTFANFLGNVFNGNIQFFAGDGQPERMRLVGDNGFFGIGTTNPTQLLDVRGSIALGNNGELRAASGEENLRMLRGLLDSAGTTLSGSGFTAARTGTGQYTVTFTQPFTTSPPSVTVNAISATPAFVHIISLSSESVVFFVRNTSNVAIDSTVNFIVLGPR